MDFTLQAAIKNVLIAGKSYNRGSHASKLLLSMDVSRGNPTLFEIFIVLMPKHLNGGRYI